MKRLIQEGADVHGRDRIGSPPLIRAVWAEVPGVLQVLIDAGADVNSTDRNGNIAIHIALRTENEEVVRVLAEAGADLTAKDAVGNPPLQVAIVLNSPQIVQILVDAGADVNGTNFIGNPLIHEAIGIGADPEIVRILVEGGADVNAIEKPGRFSVGGEDTALGKAIKLDNVEVTRILVEAGADMTAKSEPFGESAVAIAVDRGNPEIIEILKAAAEAQQAATATPTKAPQAAPPSEPRRVEARPEGMEIALSWRTPSDDGGGRVTGYRIEVSEDNSSWSVLLADTGPDVHSYTDSGLEGGSTRFYRVSAINAAGIGQPSSVASAATELCGGRESLLGAITSGEAENVQCLIRELGADVNATDDRGNPMLFWAILEESPEIVRLLVEDGADANATDDRGNPMLFWAILEESPEIVRLLVDSGADVHATDAAQGVSMLRWAILEDNPEVVRILTEAGATE